MTAPFTTPYISHFAGASQKLLDIPALSDALDLAVTVYNCTSTICKIQYKVSVPQERTGFGLLLLNRPFLFLVASNDIIPPTTRASRAIQRRTKNPQPTIHGQHSYLSTCREIRVFRYLSFALSFLFFFGHSLSTGWVSDCPALISLPSNAGWGVLSLAFVRMFSSNSK